MCLRVALPRSLSNNVLECIAEPVFDSTLSPSIIASTSSLLLRSPVAKLLAASIMLLCVPPCRRMYSAAAAEWGATTGARSSQTHWQKIRQ